MYLIFDESKIAYMNSKFTGLFYIKVILMKSVFLEDLQSLKQDRNPTSTRKEIKI